MKSTSLELPSRRRQRVYPGALNIHSLKYGMHKRKMKEKDKINLEENLEYV